MVKPQSTSVYEICRSLCIYQCNSKANSACASFLWKSHLEDTRKSVRLGWDRPASLISLGRKTRHMSNPVLFNGPLQLHFCFTKWHCACTCFLVCLPVCRDIRLDIFMITAKQLCIKYGYVRTQFSYKQEWCL